MRQYIVTKYYYYYIFIAISGEDRVGHSAFVWKRRRLGMERNALIDLCFYLFAPKARGENLTHSA